MRIKEALEQSIHVKKLILEDEKLISEISKAAETCLQAFRKGNKVLFCGNGGSAADAQHLAAELSGRFYFDRDPLPAEALHVNTSFVTAVANDYSFSEVFARMVEGTGNAGDVLVALSTSGNSKNIIRALETAMNKGMVTIGLTGSTGGQMVKHCDVIIRVPSTDTPRIQEAHITIGHIICELIEKALFA